MLNVTEPKLALEIILEHIKEINNIDIIPLTDSLGRITAEDVVADVDVPAFTRSTVDGFAVMASDTYGASEPLPAMLLNKGSIEMGEARERSINKGECFSIPTGGKLPDGADSVVMLENAEDIGDEYIYIQKSVSVLQNVTRRGEDIAEGDLVIARGTKITPSHIGVMASLGITQIGVINPPLIGIISTGDELVNIDEVPQYSQIRDTNSYLLASFAVRCGCESKRYPIVRDNREELTKVIINASNECDAVLVSGGSSAGEKDAVYSILNERGTVYFHGLAMKPGKPAMFACLNGKCIFGLPGHPAAAYFVCLRLVEPALCKLLGTEYKSRTTVATVTENIPADSGRQELVPVTISHIDGSIYAKALYMKSGVISVLSKADGYIIVDRNTEGVGKDEKVEVYLL